MKFCCCLPLFRLTLVSVLLIINQLSVLAQSRPTFAENKGQWEAAVQFRMAIPNGFMFVYADALQYSFYDAQALSQFHGSSAKSEVEAQTQEKNTLAGNALPPPNDAIQAHSYLVRFLGANPQAIAQGISPTPSRQHYYLGDDPSRWATDTQQFETLNTPSLYPGIALKLYTVENRLKYDFTIEAGADPVQIQMTYEGASQVALDEAGRLVVHTSLNQVIEKAPISYQIINGQKIWVETQFVLDGQVVRFGFPKGYNPKYPLVIDPELIFSTYSGSFADNWGFTACFDNAGRLITGGIAFGAGFPTTVGAFQVSFQGEIDVAIHQYNPQGTQLLFATYLGGAFAEAPHTMVVNAAGELYVMGSTSSTNFPTTVGAFQTAFNISAQVTPLSGIIYQNGSDIFVSRFNSNGTQLLSSTLLGGSGNDGLNLAAASIKNYGDQFRSDMALDASGNVYVASCTNSTNFPLATPFQATFGGVQDAIVCRLSADLTTLTWSSYLGGSAMEVASGLRINAAGEVYVAGGTRSPNLPVQPGAMLPTAQGGDDGFVARISGAGALLQVTYLGTTGADQAFLLDFDTNNDVWIFGQTFGNYPVSAGAYQNNNGRQFLHKIDRTLSTSLVSTRFGSGRTMPDLVPTAFMVNNCNNVYVAGWGGIINDNGSFNGTRTTGLPITPDAFKRTTQGSDFYFAIFEQNAQSLLYATFFGEDGGRGNHVDGGTCRFDKKGVIYHTACACSPTGNAGTNGFPTTPGVWSRFNNSSNCNNVGFKFDIETVVPNFQVINNTNGLVVNAGCVPFSSTLRYTGTPVRSVSFEIVGVQTFTNTTTANFTFTQEGTYTLRVLVTNPVSCVTSAVAERTFVVTDNRLTTSPDAQICRGQSTQLTANANNTLSYTWFPATGLSNPNIANPVARPDSTTLYRVLATDNNQCVTQRTVQVNVIQLPVLDFEFKTTGNCGGATSLMVQNKSTNADRYLWDLGNGEFMTGEQPPAYAYPAGGNYNLRLVGLSLNCEASLSKPIFIEDNRTPVPNTITPNGDGLNDFWVLPNRANCKVKIYNRWGSLVFQSNDYQNNWGKEAETGTYFYQMQTTSGVECNGFIEVIK